MATSRNARLVGAILAVCASLAACTSGSDGRGPTRSTSVTPAPSTTTTTPTSTTTPTVAYSARLGSAPCKAALPSSWSGALGKARLWSGKVATHVAGVPLPDSDAVLAEDDTRSTSTITMRGDGRRTVRTVARIGRDDGQGSMGDAASDGRHVAFVYSTRDGQGAQNSWRLYLWDRGSASARVIARNPTDDRGDPLAGGFVHPLLTRSAVYWIQAADNALGKAIGATGSALMRYDLATRRTTVMHSGLVTSLVAYRGDVLVTAVGEDRTPGPSGNPPLVVRAFDAATGREHPAPRGLDAGADQPDWFVTNGDLVAWNTTDGAVRGWRASWGRTRTLVPAFGEWSTAKRNDPPMDFPGYPRLLGPFLAWNATASFVLDLRSNSFVQLTKHHGGLEASGSRLALWQYTLDEPPQQGAGLDTQQWVLDTARLPRLPAC